MRANVIYINIYQNGVEYNRIWIKRIKVNGLEKFKYVAIMCTKIVEDNMD